MRKPVFPRVLLIALLYVCVFFLLVSVQFSRPAGNTLKAGSLTVTGQYSLYDEEEFPGEYVLEGDVHVLFGGMDFGLVRGDNGNSLHVTGEEGIIIEDFPDRMIISEDSVRFTFSEGTELVFAYRAAVQEIRISGVFAEEITGIELPFKLQRRAGIHNAGNGQFTVRVDGVNYSFGNSPMDIERRVLLINSGGGAVSYRAILDEKIFSPDDFILTEAQTASTYNETINRWRDQSYALWLRAVSVDNNEDIVIALTAEALRRGQYQELVAAIPQAFRTGNAKTYESSVYIGGLDQAYRSLVNVEREKQSRLTSQINEKSLEFLFEPRVLEYFSVRGNQSMITAGADLVRTIDPTILALDIIPGLLEGFIDWKTLRPGTENPFESLMEEACHVISKSLQRSASTSGGNLTGSLVFVLYEDPGELEFNLRLGKALLKYAEAEQNDPWAGIARSLILSALSGVEETAESPAALARAYAKLYRILSPSEPYPRAVTVLPQANNSWAWTTASGIEASQQNDILDINVSFPPGETHYMIVRSIRPFVRLQLYNMDFRTDPQFERYDSSGWSYISSEQILILKMRHRAQVERIRIIFREEPRPVVVPEPEETDDAAGTPAEETVRETTGIPANIPTGALFNEP